MVALQNPTVTALGPDDPDDGEEGRKQRGLAIAALVPIRSNRMGYQVPSQSNNGTYMVVLNEEPFCSCPDFEKRQEPCKHIFATSYSLRRQAYGPTGIGIGLDSVPPPPTATPWSVYNLAQSNEQQQFEILLRDLCDTIVEAPQGRGRPRIPLSDMIVACCLKVYGTMSARRSMTKFRTATAAGLMEKCPSFSSVFRYMENSAMQPVLKNLIEISSLPLIPIESRFAADASGFSTSVYDRWHDHKWGQKKAHAKYMKAHIVCGVITNIVTAVEVTDAESHDSPYLASLMEATARHFNMREVSADKGYLSRGNLHLIQEYGAEPLIPFKSNSKAEHSDGPDSLWTRCYLYYTLHKEEFKPRYHKRSNVETTFSMIKAKFGADLASKKEEALVNEVLVKVLCHNICVLVQSFYKLGVTSDFKLTDDMPVSQGDFGNSADRTDGVCVAPSTLADEATLSNQFKLPL